MDNNMIKAMEQAAAVQKLWMDSFTEMANVWTQFSPSKPPPEELRKMRSGMLKVLTECWDEFMRTPFFMEMMKNSINATLELRKMGQTTAAKVHEQTGVAASEDIDGILMAIRHNERRILDGIEGFVEKFDELGNRLGELEKLLGKIEKSSPGGDLSKITERVDGVGEKLGQVDRRFGNLENQIGKIHEQISEIETSTKSQQAPPKSPKPANRRNVKNETGRSKSK